MRPHNSCHLFNHFYQYWLFGHSLALSHPWPTPVTLPALISKGFRGLRHCDILCLPKQFPVLYTLAS